MQAARTGDRHRAYGHRHRRLRTPARAGQRIGERIRAREIQVRGIDHVEARYHRRTVGGRCRDRDRIERAGIVRGDRDVHRRPRDGGRGIVDGLQRRFDHLHLVEGSAREPQRIGRGHREDGAACGGRGARQHARPRQFESLRQHAVGDRERIRRGAAARDQRLGVRHRARGVGQDRRNDTDLGRKDAQVVGLRHRPQARVGLVARSDAERVCPRRSRGADQQAGGIELELRRQAASLLEGVAIGPDAARRDEGLSITHACGADGQPACRRRHLQGRAVDRQPVKAGERARDAGGAVDHRDAGVELAHLGGRAIDDAGVRIQL